MKLHRHLILAVTEALKEIFAEQKYADKVIEKYLHQNKKWGSRDRKFFAESVYDVVRHYRKLMFISEQLPETDENLFLNLWAIWFYLSKNTMPSTEIIKLDWDRIGRLNEQNLPRKIKYSLPDWLDELGERELGKDWDSCAKALSQQAQVHLRANSLKVSVKELQAQLRGEEIETYTTDGFPSGVSLQERKNVFITQAFQKGFFEVQDLSSQLVAPYLDPQPGERVVDACAGAGGKSLHLAALMKNKGKVLALDIHQWKLDELKKRARRAGVDIIEGRVIESSKTIKRLAEGADRLLLDVPCSGLGVLKRNPDSKWKLSLEEIERLRILQAELLENYSKMLKPGGYMVYSTCSLLPSENELQVQKFLEKSPDFKLLKSQRINPDQGPLDGFFMALLQRNP